MWDARGEEHTDLSRLPVGWRWPQAIARIQKACLMLLPCGGLRPLSRLEQVHILEDRIRHEGGAFSVPASEMHTLRRKRVVAATPPCLVGVRAKPTHDAVLRVGAKRVALSLKYHQAAS